MKFFITLCALAFFNFVTASESNYSKTLPFLTREEFKAVDEKVDNSWMYVTAVCSQHPDITNFVLTDQEVKEVIQDAIWQANTVKRLADLKSFIASNNNK